MMTLRRAPHLVDLSRYAEAIGDLMRLELVVDRVATIQESPHLYPPLLQTDKSPNDSLPPIHTHLPTSTLLSPIRFHGSSLPPHTHPGAGTLPHSFVRGVVQLTADDPPQVRWTLVIRYGGEDRWRLEGVQPGGRGSSRGFFGVSYSYNVTTLLIAVLDGCCQGRAFAQWPCMVLEDLAICSAAKNYLYAAPTASAIGRTSPIVI